MKKLFIVLGLGMLLASCSTSDSLVTSEVRDVNWRCSDSPSCNITAVHHHAW